MTLWKRGAILALLGTACCGPAHAADTHGLDAAGLSAWWGLPFAGLLLSIALLPQLSPLLWHRHFPKIAAGWALLFLVPFAAAFGVRLTARQLVDVAVGEYLPFIILLLALFVISGGVRVRGNMVGTPGVNTGMIALGMALASLAGTTGAAMLLVRPLIQANLKRRYNAHVLIFFIFLVANIGGALTPLGDPPLFLGFLQGVAFGWTVTHMAGPMLICSVLLLSAFYALDRRIWARDGGPRQIGPLRIGLRGWHNLLYLVLAVGAVLVSGLWRPGVSVLIWHTSVPLESLARDVVLLGLACLSWATTPSRVRIENAFSWDPMLEVVYLFAAIFVTILPVLEILRAGASGAFAPIVGLAALANGQPNNAAYFWLTGLLSSFLDNAPTYLIFFNMAGGDPVTLMGPLWDTLLAISTGSVFMGAMTYVGNAPNFMVRSIASERGIRMPSFAGYLAWSSAFLLPVFAAVTVLFFVL